MEAVCHLFVMSWMIKGDILIIAVCLFLIVIMCQNHQYSSLSIMGQEGSFLVLVGVTLSYMLECNHNHIPLLSWLIIKPIGLTVCVSLTSGGFISQATYYTNLADSNHRVNKQAVTGNTLDRAICVCAHTLWDADYTPVCEVKKARHTWITEATGHKIR